ncbi:helix-turn-helix domain-containing protein [Microlunatus speluncae]|uniref:helix-turn-helix domain-containing protein n=1 Tax=Microlunatus speluncae TaxID=2594267 RepID=UPI001C2DBF51|nr:helix-turn-helix domain-containing protein [Microlunatus speluncae]
MSNTAQVVTSSQDEAQGLAQVLSLLRSHEPRITAGPEATYYLSGANADERIQLTKALYDILTQAVEALTRGQSVSILALEQEITTQQAAEILGVSRPTVVRLINDHELPATVPGATRRKLRLRDVLRYRDHLHDRRSNFIAETAAEYGEVDPAEADDLLAEVRSER